MRLIDADALYESEKQRCFNSYIVVGTCTCDNIGLETVLDDAPTVDAVEVVRCKDCKHSYKDLFGFVCAHGIWDDCIVPSNFYCAEGEREDE